MEKIEITEETDPPTIRLNIWIERKWIRYKRIHNPTYWKNWVDTLSDEK